MVLIRKLGGFCPETKTVYEFLGDYWHGNPKKYKGNLINPHENKSFGLLYKNTLEKIAKLKAFGYKVVHIWESAFKRSIL